jgi:hypothetical protein
MLIEQGRVYSIPVYLIHDVQARAPGVLPDLDCS